MKKILNNTIKMGILALLLFPMMSFKNEPQKPIDGNSKIQWLTIEEAYKRWQKEPRKFVIDVYTDWCGWCKVMDKNTFMNQTVADFVNRSYYPVKLNAEQRADITLGTQVYKFVDNGQGGGVHQLGASLLNNQLSYPTVVFLDEKMGMIQPVPGYRDALEFHQLLTYFQGNYNRIEQFDKYKTETYLQIYATTKPVVEAVKEAGH